MITLRYLVLSVYARRALENSVNNASYDQITFVSAGLVFMATHKTSVSFNIILKKICSRYSATESFEQFPSSGKQFVNFYGHFGCSRLLSCYGNSLQYETIYFSQFSIFYHLQLIDVVFRYIHYMVKRFDTIARKTAPLLEANLTESSRLRTHLSL